MNRIQDLRAAGVGSAEIQRLRRNQERLTWGVYTEKGLNPQDRYLLKCRAVLARLQQSAVLAGPSAAAARGIPLVGEPPTKVFVRNVPRGTYARDVAVLPEGPGEVVGDLPVTTAPWTVLDCARILRSRDALIVADAALAEGLCTPHDLTALAAELRGRRGAGRARWIALNADPRSESPGETWTRLIVRQLGYDVVPQVYVTNGTREARLDLLLANGRTAIEFDGLIKYRLRGVKKVIQEHLRDADLQEMGFTVLHVIWQQLFNPDQLDRRLRFAGAIPARPGTSLTW